MYNKAPFDARKLAVQKGLVVAIPVFAIPASKARGVPCRTSMERAATMSACLAMISARWRASTPRAVISCVPLISARPCRTCKGEARNEGKAAWEGD